MTRRHGPLIPLYLAYSPELVLLARCLWYVEDAVRARSLVQAEELPGLARPCFTLLTSADRPVSDEPTDPRDTLTAARWLVQENPTLGPLVEQLVCVPSAVLGMVSLADIVRALRWTRSSDESLLEDYPALVRWRDVVLRGQRRASPLAIAAAWELEALEAELAGHRDEADDARSKAREAVARRSA